MSKTISDAVKYYDARVKMARLRAKSKKTEAMWGFLLSVARYEESIRALEIPVLWDKAHDAIDAALDEAYLAGRDSVKDGTGYYIVDEGPENEPVKGHE